MSLWASSLSIFFMQLDECPYQLRVRYIGKRCPILSRDVNILLAFLPFAKAAMRIGVYVYIGFLDRYAAQHAIHLCSNLGIISSRLMDPFALHCTLARYQTLGDLTDYFSAYGSIECITEHSSSKGRYAFINFNKRSAPLRALHDGEVVFIQGSKVKIRGKVLSNVEPFAPKPYSPARYYCDTAQCNFAI